MKLRENVQQWWHTFCTFPPSPPRRFVPVMIANETRIIDLRNAPIPQSSNEALLVALVHALAAVRIAEIGILYGETTVCLAHALPAHGELYACDINVQRALPLIRAWKMEDKIKLLEGHSHETIHQIPFEVDF